MTEKQDVTGKSDTPPPASSPVSVAETGTVTETGGSRHTAIAFTLGVIGYFMITIDLTIVSVAMSPISHSLGFSASTLSWITTAFTLTYAGCMMFGGRVVDLLGRRWSFVLGIALFTAASLGSALAPNAGVLIGARAVQGVGAAITTPCMLALILDLYPEGPGRRRAMGVFQSVIGAGAGFGLMLGGILTDTLNWRWLFLVNVPVGALILILAPRFLPRTAGQGFGSRRFDAVGALTVTLALALLIYTLSSTVNHGWLSVATLGGLAGSIVLALLFGWHENGSADPLLPLRIPRNPVVYTANLRAAIVSGTFLAALVLLALDDEQVLGHSPTRSGLSILPAALMILALGRLGPRLVGRFGIRLVAMVGALVLAGGLLWFAIIPSNSFVVSRLVPDLLIGFGATVANLANMLSATSGAVAAERGTVSALQYTAQQTGQSTAVAAFAAVAAGHTAALLGGTTHPDHATALHNGYQFAFAVAAVAGVISALLAIPRRNFAR